MSENITIPKKDWDTLVKGVADIRNALAGSEELGTTGLIKQVQDHDKRIKEYEEIKNKGKGIAWTLGIVWIALTTFLTWLFSKY